MAFNIYKVELDYDIRHGRKNPIYFRNLNHNIPNSSRLRDYLLDVTLTPVGEHHASGISVSLYKAREYYYEGGSAIPVNKWGTYGVDSNSIPPANIISPNGEELLVDTPDANFELVKWANKYWTLVPGSTWNDHIDNPGHYDRVVNPGWPGYRHSHTFIFGFDYDDSAVINFPAPFRVTANITGFGEKYMLLINLWRGKRTIKKVIEFPLVGEPTNSDLLKAAYIPVAIVYSPPGQDMTNSMVETERHGTRFTFESTNVVSATWAEQTGVSASIGTDIEGASAGVKAEHEEGSSESQTTTDSSTSAISLTKINETMITANNRTSIGRAYWGPLGDLFVIIKDLLFYGYQVFSEDTAIAMLPLPKSPNARKIICSTRELLQPEPGSAAFEIEWEDRKRILRLNPFIIDNEAILDDVANGTRPLEDAVNPDLDPNRHNSTRAIKVLSLNLGKGSEVNFYESKGVETSTAESHATAYQTTFTSATSLGFELEIPFVGVGFGVDFSSKETISYQTTSEIRLVNEKIETAKCYLVRNQNDPNIDFLDVYYDTIFGTFLFSKRNHSAECVPLGGRALNPHKVAAKEVRVSVLSSTRDLITQTTTNGLGIYKFDCIKLEELGEEFYVVAGDQELKVNFKQAIGEDNMIHKDFENVRRVIDIENITYREIMEIFDIDIAQVTNLSRALNNLNSEDEILDWLNFNEKERERFKVSNKIIWTKENRDRLKTKIWKLPANKRLKTHWWRFGKDDD